MGVCADIGLTDIVTEDDKDVRLASRILRLRLRLLLCLRSLGEAGG